MILVTGATGFVGSKILSSCKNVIACKSLRNTSQEEVKRIVEESQVDTIIHTSAIADIGVCEKNEEESYRANVQIPVNLAKACVTNNVKLVCFSSDQVYSGCDEIGPYTEDMAKPSNVYSKHKLEMENRVLDIIPSAVMLRAEWMYDYYLKKPNYFMNVLNATDSLSFSSKQFRGITYLQEVVENVEKVVKLSGGAYNFGSETTKSMYEITKEFLHRINKKIELNDIAPRHNLWMNCEKATLNGVTFSNVEDGLIKCAKDYNLL